MRRRGVAASAGDGPVQVRPGRLLDARPLALLARAVAAEPDGWLLSSPASWTARGERRFLRYCAGSADAGVLVAVASGTIVGRLSIVRDVHPASAHVASVGLMVAAAARRRGVGAELLRAAEEWAAARGILRLELQVLPGNDAARALYASVGYREEGVRRLHVVRGGALEDAIAMAKLLGAAGATLAADE